MSTKERLDLAGHKALITGSSQGIGAAVALSLAEFGADVVIHCRGEVEKAQAVAEKARTYGVKADVIVCDLADSNSAEQLYKLATETIGSIDILILNASIQVRKKWFEVSPGIKKLGSFMKAMHSRAIVDSCPWGQGYSEAA